METKGSISTARRRLGRLAAVLTTFALAFLFTGFAGSSASAAAESCDKLGYTKVDQASGSVSDKFGTIEWSGDTLTYDVESGYTIDVCIKSGSQVGTEEYTGLTGADSITIAQNISHIGYKFTATSTGGTTGGTTGTTGGTTGGTNSGGAVAGSSGAAPEAAGSAPAAVQGSEATSQVPTAVAAGVPAADAGQGAVGSLGTSLAGAGLVLLLTTGWLWLTGGRARGAHKA